MFMLTIKHFQRDITGAVALRTCVLTAFGMLSKTCYAGKRIKHVLVMRTLNKKT